MTRTGGNGLRPQQVSLGLHANGRAGGSALGVPRKHEHRPALRAVRTAAERRERWMQILQLLGALALGLAALQLWDWSGLLGGRSLVGALGPLYSVAALVAGLAVARIIRPATIAARPTRWLLVRLIR